MVVVAGLEVKQEPGVGRGLCLALVPACAALLMLAPHILAAARDADELKGHMHKDLRHCTVKLKQQQQQQLYLGATDAAVLPAAVAAAVAAAAVTLDAVAPAAVPVPVPVPAAVTAAAVPVAVPAAVEVHAAAVEPVVQSAAATWPGPAADASAAALAPQPVSAAAPAAAPEVAAAGHTEQVARREGASAGTAAVLGLYQFLPVS